MKKNSIFNFNLNNKLRLVSFNEKFDREGKIKYLPPVSKEWKNTVYSYNKNEMKNLSIYNYNINKIIKSYFNIYFKNKFIMTKFIGNKKRRNLIRKIYTSKVETKHTNSKVKITLYTLNIGKNKLHKEYKYLSKFFTEKILKLWKRKLIKRILIQKKKNLLLNKSMISKNKNIFLVKYKLFNESLKWSNLYLKLYMTKVIKSLYSDKLKFLRKYQFNYYLNKFKFDKQIMLPKLHNILSKVFENKKIEFNVINLKSITLNPEIFTEVLGLKLKRKKANVLRTMNNILEKVKLPQVNTVIERGILRENTFKSINQKNNTNLLYSIFEKDLNKNKYGYNFCHLNNLLSLTSKYESGLTTQNITSNIKLNNDYVNISNLIFNSIKHKNMGGIRLQVKGRLTKRPTAARSSYKLKWKGGLKDIDSSYKRISTVNYRGLSKSNLIYSISNSKRPVGAFAVKGWTSGK
jgi:hypothetical protein